MKKKTNVDLSKCRRGDRLVTRDGSLATYECKCTADRDHFIKIYVPATFTYATVDNAGAFLKDEECGCDVVGVKHLRHELKRK